MPRNCVIRTVLVVSIVGVVSLLGCQPPEPEMTPTVPPVEPTETAPPDPTETPTPGPVSVAISPTSGPPGTEVVAVVTGFPAETQIELCLALQDQDYDVVDTPRTPSDGPLTTSVLIPESAEPGEQWVVVAATEDRETEAVSGAFQVTAPPTPIAETPTPSEVLLLPDLVVLPPEAIFIQFEQDQKMLRFETSFANMGEADLHLVGERDLDLEVVRAIQTFLTATGEERSEEIGQFVFHPGHEHWHLEEFAQYELWSDPQVGQGELVASAEKVSFCMFDYAPYDLTLPDAPQERQYPTCDTEVQGLSVGWLDAYQPALEGQALDITGLPDGRYRLRKLANPARHIIEGNYDNNEASVTIEISGTNVVILED